jgi:hypothetical protein
MLRSSALPLSIALALTGCVHHAQTTRASRPSLRLAAGANVSGTWDWMFRSRDDQGDERLEQEEWHLEQVGARIQGHYDRKVTMLSVDDRLFRCNQKLGFTKVTRVHVAGQVVDGRIVLREVGFEAKPGPCDDGARNLVEYRGMMLGEKLTLSWTEGAAQTLIRRLEQSVAPLVQAADFTPDGTPQVAESETSTAPAELAGDWEWELRSVDAEGDFRVEREVWHLTESTDGVRGYYDRTVRSERGEGLFTCNGQERKETATRYTVVGQRFGNQITLREVEYKAERSPCDNAKRRLDTYHGRLADGESLVLSWGPGNQILRRKK